MVDFILYGSTITDYFELSFWRKKSSEKSKYCTWRTHKRFIFEVDDNETIHRLTNKAEMYHRLAGFLKREQAYTRSLSYEEFLQFCKKHPVFFLKPCGNSCGEGIEKIVVNNAGLVDTFKKVIKVDAVLDTPVIQHKTMAALNERSVNTLRIFTFRDKGSVYFTGCALRIGTDSFIDNYSAGGLVCSVDMRTGRTKEKAENNFGQRFSEHPISHTKLEGFIIPKWEKVLDYVFKMAQVYELNYVAWDIAIGEIGIDLIEANPAGMINTIQIAGGGPKKQLILNLESEWRKKDGKQSDSYRMIICE